MIIETKLFDTFELNKEITIVVNGMTLDKVNGEFALGVTNDGAFSGISQEDFYRFFYLGENTKEVLPKTIKISSISEKDIGSLVAIDSVQFVEESTFVVKNKATESVLTDCAANELPLVTSKRFENGDAELPTLNGIIIGILQFDKKYQLRIRNMEDALKMNAEKCNVLQNATDAIFISEIADPDNNSTTTNMRFIELYNAGDKSIDMSGWSLRRYTNANTAFTATGVIDLTGHTIAPLSTFVIAADAVSFNAVYGFPPDMEGGTGGAADSNGDDNIELVNNKGLVVDVFGVVGEDGSGTNHEFEDGRAIRKLSVERSNTVFTFSEWTIYNDTGAEGTINEPKIAPQDFNPGVR